MSTGRPQDGQPPAWPDDEDVWPVPEAAGRGQSGRHPSGPLPVGRPGAAGEPGGQQPGGPGGARKPPADDEDYEWIRYLTGGLGGSPGGVAPKRQPDADAEERRGKRGRFGSRKSHHEPEPEPARPAAAARPAGVGRRAASLGATPAAARPPGSAARSPHPADAVGAGQPARVPPRRARGLPPGCPARPPARPSHRPATRSARRQRLRTGCGPGLRRPHRPGDRPAGWPRPAAGRPGLRAGRTAELPRPCRPRGRPVRQDAASGPVRATRATVITSMRPWASRAPGAAGAAPIPGSVTSPTSASAARTTRGPATTSGRTMAGRSRTLAPQGGSPAAETPGGSRAAIRGATRQAPSSAATPALAGMAVPPPTPVVTLIGAIVRAALPVSSPAGTLAAGAAARNSRAAIHGVTRAGPGGTTVLLCPASALAGQLTVASGRPSDKMGGRARPASLAAGRASVPAIRVVPAVTAVMARASSPAGRPFAVDPPTRRSEVARSAARPTVAGATMRRTPVRALPAGQPPPRPNGAGEPARRRAARPSATGPARRLPRRLLPDRPFPRRPFPRRLLPRRLPLPLRWQTARPRVARCHRAEGRPAKWTTTARRTAPPKPT